jgi:hypothetical protein
VDVDKCYLLAFKAFLNEFDCTSRSYWPLDPSYNAALPIYDSLQGK